MSPICCAFLLMMWLPLVTTNLLGPEEVSEFFVRKMEYFFDLFDRDNDGGITVEDYHIIAKTLADIANFNAAQFTDLRDKGVQLIWNAFKFGEDELGNPLNKKEFIEAMAKLKTNPATPILVGTTMALGLKVFDTNSDGVLQPSEHSHFLQSLGVTPEGSKVAFKVTDTNGDGTISTGEFSSGVLGFWTVEDESNAIKNFWGEFD